MGYIGATTFILQDLLISLDSDKGFKGLASGHILNITPCFKYYTQFLFTGKCCPLLLIVYPFKKNCFLEVSSLFELSKNSPLSV